ncbi:MAG: iron-containing alcohol dehydrogenase [Lachnospiraceae bacterium]|nr:iron-containing alcohol dehydrogenase [Lachnospiraceae bacterium]
MARKFLVPKTVWLGQDALQSAQMDICSLGGKALIVSGQSMIRQGYMKMLTDMLDQNRLAWVIYSDISGEPTDQMIEKGAAVYMENKCDFIIGFGGGSPLDSAKAIGVLAVCGGKISDYMGKEITTALPPVVAIPTTAGTGSEVTQFTIITDTATDVKMLLKGNSLIPAVAVVDPVFTLQATESVTVAAGLDALTHAVEAYTSKKAYDQSDRYALSAVKRIFKYLPLVLQEPSNIVYREEMSTAAYEAGVSFSNSSVTLVHGMSRPIGALFHVPHGISNAMLLDVCLSFAAQGASELFGNLARVIGEAEDTDNDWEAANKFLKSLKNLCITCHVPTLAEYGIDKNAFLEQADKMAGDAVASGSPSNTRRETGKDEIKELYYKLWEN